MVFISYKSEEKVLADDVKEKLVRNGIDVWMAPESIPGGSTYPKEIHSAIKKSDVLILVLTDLSQKSLWIQSEIEIARMNNKTIIPIAFSDVSYTDEFEMLLVMYQRLDVDKNNVEESFLRLINRIKEIESHNQSKGIGIVKAVSKDSLGSNKERKEQRVVKNEIVDKKKSIEKGDANNSKVSDDTRVLLSFYHYCDLKKNNPEEFKTIYENAELYNSLFEFDRKKYETISSPRIPVINSAIDNPIIGDEFSFVKIVGDEGVLFDEANVEVGGKYEVRVYYHNNCREDAHQGTLMNCCLRTVFSPEIDNNHYTPIVAAINTLGTHVYDCVYFRSKTSVKLIPQIDSLIIHNNSSSNGKKLSMVNLLSEKGVAIGDYYDSLGRGFISANQMGFVSFILEFQ